MPTSVGFRVVPLPPNATPEEIAAEIDRVEREMEARPEAFVLADLPEPARRAFEEQQQLIDRLLAERARLSLRLPSSVQSDTPLDTMSSALVTDVPARGRPFEVEHPFLVKLQAMRKPNGKKMKIADVAVLLSKALGRPIARTTVRSWYLPKGHDDARSIREDAVKFFEAKPWSIPRSAWKNDITDAD